MPWTVIVLAGGRSTRLGSDKVQATLDDRRLIDHVLAALPADALVVIVGPDPDGLGHEYALTREPDPGTGPAAAIAAGLALTSTDLVAVLAVDMPFAGGLLPTLVDELSAAPAEIDAVILVDADGHEQPLCAAYRATALRRALSALGDPAGRSVRDVRKHLKAITHAAPEPERLLDVDTPDDLEVARRTVRLNRD